MFSAARNPTKIQHAKRVCGRWKAHAERKSNKIQHRNAASYPPSERRARTEAQLRRVVRVKQLDADEYLMPIEERRDGRCHPVTTVGDLQTWLLSFRDGRCLQPGYALCGVCDKAHADRGANGELLSNCISCTAELLVALSEEE